MKHIAMQFAWFYCPLRMVRATYPTKIGITVAHTHDKNNKKARDIHMPRAYLCNLNLLKTCAYQ